MLQMLCISIAVLLVILVAAIVIGVSVRSPRLVKAMEMIVLSTFIFVIIDLVLTAGCLISKAGS